MLTLITGGARSGKSRYAQEQALAHDARPCYLATARHWDADFSQRIARHQSERRQGWDNQEIETAISNLQSASQAIVVDCITLWLTNLFSDLKGDAAQALAATKQELDLLFARQDKNWYLVSNEIGMGLHAESPAGRKFTDLQGFTNQYIAQQADRVILMVSGLPLVIKDETTTYTLPGGTSAT